MKNNMSISNESIVLQFIKKATENPNVKTREVLEKIALQKCMYFFNLTIDHFISNVQIMILFQQSYRILYMI